MPVRREYFICWSLCTLVFAAGCGSKHYVRVPVYRPAAAEDGSQPATRSDGRVAEGVASWYGPPFHGRMTANGEVYNMNSLTAAHPTLPFDTRVRVTNKENNKQVVVRINDRGPFVDGRIIDLSKEAAKRLGMVNEGIVPVHLETASAHALSVQDGQAKYTVQLGFFTERRNAVLYYGKLKKRYPNVSVEPSRPGGYRIQLGIWNTRSEAEKLLQRLQRESYNGFVRVLD